MTDDELGGHLQEYGVTQRGQEYLAPLMMTEAGRSVILRVAERSLREGDSVMVSETLYGLRQLARFDDTPFRPLFYAHFVTSSAYQATLELVFARNFGKREAAIYMLGQFCHKAALPTLYRAFDQYCDADPLILSTLTGEIDWLEAGENPTGGEERYRRILHSPLYLCRWSLLNSESVTQDRPELLKRLAEDSNPLVAAEAGYLIGLHLLTKEVSQETKGERRRKFKAYRNTRPTMGYFETEIAFRRRHDWEANQGDYSLAAMENFVAAQIRPLL